MSSSRDAPRLVVDVVVTVVVTTSLDIVTFVTTSLDNAFVVFLREWPRCRLQSLQSCCIQLSVDPNSLQAATQP